MGEFMTQPLTGADALLLVAATVFTWTFLLWLLGFLWHKRDAKVEMDKLQNQIYRTDKSLDNLRCEVRAQVRDLDETVESMSDTLWAIEDDVEALRRPAWKKLLRRLSA